MANNITVKDAAGLNEVIRTVENGGVHTPVHRMEGYDPADDMMKMKSVQKKWRDSFTRPLTDQWDVSSGDGTTATISAGVLTLASGTTAGGYAEMLSKETFTIPCRVMAGLQSGATRQANTHHYVELVSVDPVTGQPNELHRVAWDIGGAAATSVTQADHEVQNGGLIPLVGNDVAINTTASYTILELEPFSDEAYFHARQLDNATVGRSASFVRQQQIPDPNALYKIRVRSLNFGAWGAITGAVAGTGNVIRITRTGHGGTTGDKFWVEALHGITNNGGVVRGVFTVTVVDANTLELNGTVFGGTYVTGSGRCARGLAPASSINFQLQFINCQDYAELTAEITAGRGSTAAGQASSVLLAGATAATTPIGQVTFAASQTVGLVAGAAAIGDVGVQYRANATGAASRTHFVSAATTNATIVKNAAGRLVGWCLSNTNAAWRYVKLHNQTTTPTAGSGVVQTIAIPPNGTSVISIPGGVGFSTGIGLTMVTGSADADTTAVGAGDIVGDLFWA